MSSRFNFKRWLKIVALACLAGVLLPCVFVYARRRFQPPGPILVLVQRPPSLPQRISQEDVRADFIQVIDSQLSAFRKNDYPAAYNFASADLHDSMPLPVFERMVRRDYPAIARSFSAEFGAALDNGTDGMVTVEIRSRDGKVVRYSYLLKLESGNWKVNGVVALRASSMEI